MGPFHYFQDHLTTFKFCPFLESNATISRLFVIIMETFTEHWAMSNEQCSIKYDLEGPNYSSIFKFHNLARFWYENLWYGNEYQYCVDTDLRAETPSVWLTANQNRQLLRTGPQHEFSSGKSSSNSLSQKVTLLSLSIDMIWFPLLRQSPHLSRRWTMEMPSDPNTQCTSASVPFWTCSLRNPRI